MIIPAIDLIDGQVVRLFQGDYGQKTAFDLDPLTQLLGYEADGAALLHLVDLSGAKDPSKRQTALIERIAANLTTPLQVGGGIRSSADVDALLGAGVKRVVIGSLAVKSPELVLELFDKYGGDAICLALDVNIDEQGNKMVAVHGWQQGGGKSLESLVDTFLPAGLKHALVTDISRDGTLAGANTALYTELAARFDSIRWQASGGVASLDDVKAVKASGASGIIIGKALLTGLFSAREAIQCWPNA
ncbi:1-(5-phosphoribosyl)-5-[(5-phosphoribosylamino)methylideneamino]imidazole-4-carboxamide isomerase [Shewanella sp. JM162201]|uniref:1-(5-phosphoribosyl)-5-[(5-phosphoribosylamino)methylideneamino] imidazole-4-carboxamide isomerase n=1 Tax=Shewanella jiangmenensis TaxID=2837387 RepID=A0ABS5V6P8_9GAMM|nr:1-(5-phosphoribosyl)-5-[(5-phosphoribosylamino)methylideneamino]imidazole-4-carboxamide isomerase [Shewanella jiangmenensis]MBT1445595.1 1-(5-phosphoribosyl)-5-[(5-phosphoribosylamino)methylideneamino]imidazole-4-carboxamide isomerase [Shewanella jiangmenensis]